MLLLNKLCFIYFILFTWACVIREARAENGGNCTKEWNNVGIKMAYTICNANDFCLNKYQEEKNTNEFQCTQETCSSKGIWKGYCQCFSCKGEFQKLLFQFLSLG